jgi:hypothetical protein
MTDALFDVVSVHCAACDHVASGLTPQAAHDAMEGHYRDDHGWCGHLGQYETAMIMCARRRGGGCVRLLRCLGCGGTVTADDLAAFRRERA